MRCNTFYMLVLAVYVVYIGPKWRCNTSNMSAQLVLNTFYTLAPGGPAIRSACWPQVALALQYIGMKDNIVVRFSEERIDGRLLADLSPDLLAEGFPDMNAWDRQKLMKFVHGWRPKRSAYSYI